MRLALLATDCSTISSRQPGPWLGRHARAKSRILVPHNPNIQGENYYRCLRLPTICRIVAFERNTKNKPGLTIPDNVSFQDHVRVRGGDDELLTNCTLKKIRSEIKDGDLHGACGSIVMMKNTTAGDEYEFHAFPCISYIHVIPRAELCKKNLQLGMWRETVLRIQIWIKNLATSCHPASWSFQTLRMLLDTHEFTQVASNKAGRMVLLGIFPNKQLPNGVPACVVESWKLSRNRRPVQLRHHFSLQV